MQANKNINIITSYHITSYHIISNHIINPQVLECGWNELIGRVSSAAHVDDIISAQNTFIHEILTRALLAPETQVCLF